MSATASRIPATKRFTRRENLRIASVQFSPAHSKPQESVRVVEKIIEDEKLEPDALDLLILPELALTGYVFESEQQIQPLLENVESFPRASDDPNGGMIKSENESNFSSTTSNLSLQLGRDLSKRLKSYVIIGFPETKNLKNETESEGSPFQSSGPIDSRPKDLLSKQESQGKTKRNFNSAALFSREGELIKVFSKHFLFENDEKWAEEGAGFEWVDLPDLGRICVAICMDLNPYRFKSPFSNFELSRLCHDEGVDILAMPMAWLLSPSKGSETRSGSELEVEALKPCIENINYWAWRLEGIWGERSQNDLDGKNGKEVIFVASNRIGTEGKSTFGGSSCGLRLRKHSEASESEDVKKPELLGFLGKGQSGILKFQT